ncbi:MAG: hypothetical protein V4507_15495 [Verrucomicrobiota bacterium]
MPSKNRYLYWILLLLVTSCSKTDENGRIYSYKSFNPIKVLNVHSSQNVNLVVDGEKYKKVIGQSPYYLKIEKLNALFFVEEINLGNYIHHIYVLDSKTDIQFEYAGGGFGFDLGVSNEVINSKLININKLWLYQNVNPKYLVYEYDLNSKTCRHWYQDVDPSQTLPAP